MSTVNSYGLSTLLFSLYQCIQNFNLTEYLRERYIRTTLKARFLRSLKIAGFSPLLRIREEKCAIFNFRKNVNLRVVLISLSLYLYFMNYQINIFLWIPTSKSFKIKIMLNSLFLAVESNKIVSQHICQKVNPKFSNDSSSFLTQVFFQVFLQILWDHCGKTENINRKSNTSKLMKIGLLLEFRSNFRYPYKCPVKGFQSKNLLALCLHAPIFRDQYKFSLFGVKLSRLDCSLLFG